MPLTIDDWRLTIDDWRLTIDDWRLTIDVLIMTSEVVCVITCGEWACDCTNLINFGPDFAEIILGFK